LLKPASNYASFKPQLDRIPAEVFPEDRKFNPLATHPYMLFNSLAHAQKYSSEELVRAMGLLLDCNLAMISSGTDDALLLQQTVVGIVGTQTPPRA